jgi:hypothetical protein|tara:strand:+ start:1231 stop:1455 length:225 start_codon:yes stop_codon:yes gene_type:complete
MGHMKFIYEMVEDGSYASFKLMTRAAHAGNQQKFVWSGMTLEVNYAQFVCEYVDKFLQQDYDKHLIEQAERYEY